MRRRLAMKILKSLSTAALWLACSIALAHSDGIYNPKANSIGNFEGVDNPTASGGGVSFSLAYGQAANNGTNAGTTYDYGTLTYGSGCTRVIVASIWIPGASFTITGITVGGVALAQVPSAYAVLGSSIVSDVWESTAALSGSSGDVEITYSANLGFTSSASVYCLKTNTPTASAANGTGSATATVSSSIVVPTGGGALVLTGNGNGNSTTPSNTTVDANPLPGGNNAYYGHTTSTGTVPVSATYGSTGNVLSLVSWGP
jgi:hypothetical protein